MGITLTAASQNAMCDALVDRVDGGSTDPTGDLVLRTAAEAEAATLAFSNPAFGAAAAGVANANAISDDTSATGGTVDRHTVHDRDNTEIWRGTVGTSGADLNLSSVSIAALDTVSINSYSVTQPAS